MVKHRKRKKHSPLKNFLIPHKGNNYKPLLFTAGSIAVVVALIVLFEGAYLVQTRLVEKRTNFFASVLPSVLIDLTNADRAQNGVPALMSDATLTQAAQLKANDMAAKGYFAHVSPDGKTPWYWLNQVGYKYTYAGENLAVNFNDSQDVEEAWMASPTHHANIVKSQYTRVGYAVAKGMYEGKETTFVVQEFATPAGTSPAPLAVAKVPTKTIASTITSIAKEVTQPKAPTVATKTPEKTPAVATATAPVVLAEANTSGASTTQVLGTETGGPATPETINFASSFLAKVVASPNHTSTYVLGAIAAAALILLLIAIFVHVRVQYLEVIGGGFVVAALALALLIFNTTSSTNVQVPSDTQSASVIHAF